MNQSAIQSKSQLLDSPIPHDHILRALVVTRLVAARRLSPGRYRIAAARSFTFAAAVRVIDRVHRDAANVRPHSLPARAAGFTERNIFVLDVADLSDGRATHNRHAPNFARRHAQLRVISLLSRATAQTNRPRAPSVRLCRDAAQCCESACPAEYSESAKYCPAECPRLRRWRSSCRLPIRPAR